MPRPAAILLLAAAAALALAPARAMERALLPIEIIAPAFENSLRISCGDTLFPPSAELTAAAAACGAAVDAAGDAPLAECPSAECRALAEDMGPFCWKGYHQASNALRVAVAVALEGGKALPPAAVAKLQNVSAALTEVDPVAYPSGLAAALAAGNATAAAALRKEAAYATALETACRPDLAPAPAPPAAPAPAASDGAGGASTYEEAVAAIYKDDLPACKGVLFPASADFKVAQSTCAGGAWWEFTATECPAKGFICAAAAPLWGPDCLSEFTGTLARALNEMSAAFSGGPAVPAADVARFQAWRDLLTRDYEAYWPRLDIAASMESGDDIVHADMMTNFGKAWSALATACAAAAGAGPAPAPAAAAAGGSPAAASGARAPAAAAAAALLLAALAA
jgi:hypothetical protein